MTTASQSLMNSGKPCDWPGTKPGDFISAGQPSGPATKPSALTPIRERISMIVLLSEPPRAGGFTGDVGARRPLSTSA
jgi:hypothetical protein